MGSMEKGLRLAAASPLSAITMIGHRISERAVAVETSLVEVLLRNILLVYARIVYIIVIGEATFGASYCTRD